MTKEDSITINIKVAGREGFTAIIVPKAVAVAEITVDPESGNAALTTVYQNSGGALKVGDEPKDCTIIRGDKKVVISRTTAENALQAMRKRAERGDYAGMFADDAGFINASIRELEKASEYP